MWILLVLIAETTAGCTRCVATAAAARRQKVSTTELLLVMLLLLSHVHFVRILVLVEDITVAMWKVGGGVRKMIGDNVVAIFVHFETNVRQLLVIFNGVDFFETGQGFG